MTTVTENRNKQLKNAKRGGYAPTIAKDVNKRKVQKIEAYVNDLKKLLSDFVEADLYDKGARCQLQSTIDDLTEILRSK